MVNQNEDVITIKITGSKKFRQELADLIFKTLMEDDIQITATKPGNGFTFESSIEPSEDVI